MTLIRNANEKISNRMTRYIPLPMLRASYGFLLALGAPLGWMLVQWLADRDPFSADNLDYLLYAYMTLATAVVFTGLGCAIGRREQLITGMALTDSLTALYNKRYYKSRLEQEFERFRRQGVLMSIIQIDLDHFKKINDSWGHQAGDEVLRVLGALLLANCRKNEVAARVGGEELSVIVCDSDGEQAYQLAERLRKQIESAEIPWQGQRINVTASFGVACSSQGDDNAWAVYQNADQALYRAKKEGRNQTSVYVPIP